MNTISLQLPDGKKYDFPEGITLWEISKKYPVAATYPVAVGIFNGEEIDLQKPLHADGKVAFIAINTEAGMRTYERSLLFLFLVAARQVCPEIQMETRNTLGSALYLVAHNGSLDKQNLTDITKKMQEMVAADEPIKYQYVTEAEVVRYSQMDGTVADRIGLVGMLPGKQKFVANVLAGEYEYFFGPVLPSVGLLQAFELIKFEEGVVINKPNVASYPNLSPWSRTQKINSVYREAEEWSAMIGCNTVAKLNSIIDAGQADKIIRVAEALQEKKIAGIADKITHSKKDIRLVLIAGPSSSGKTSFAQRLSDQLQVNGVKPLPISMDNYYLNRADTPRKPDGSYDFECVEAIDLPLFNEHLSLLLQGKTIKLPKYDFRYGIREYRGEEMSMGPNSVIVIEGIHGLNEKLTSAVPSENKLKIFVSALTPMSLDNFNRIHTTDIRLLRRMVRDSQFRSHDAAMTIELWPSVRAGEDKYIFPFQEDANIFFNTSLIYEPAVLKKYAEPLLQAIKATEPSYTVARRLLDLLQLIKPLADDTIPLNSILREFLGGSVFKDAL